MSCSVKDNVFSVGVQHRHHRNTFLADFLCTLTHDRKIVVNVLQRKRRRRGEWEGLN